jgi:hypothetical protein
MSGDMPPLPNTPSWRDSQKKKQRDNLMGLSNSLADDECERYPHK